MTSVALIGLAFPTAVDPRRAVAEEVERLGRRGLVRVLDVAYTEPAGAGGTAVATLPHDERPAGSGDADLAEALLRATGPAAEDTGTAPELVGIGAELIGSLAAGLGPDRRGCWLLVEQLWSHDLRDGLSAVGAEVIVEGYVAGEALDRVADAVARSDRRAEEAVRAAAEEGRRTLQSLRRSSEPTRATVAETLGVLVAAGELPAERVPSSLRVLARAGLLGTTTRPA